MKRTHLFLALLLTFAALPLFAARRANNVVDDVIRMQKSGMAEDEIIAFVHKGESRFDITADDMIALHDAGVSRAVIKAILDESEARGERRDGDRYRGSDSGYGYGYAAPPLVYAYGGYPYYYDPFYYPYYYDPFFYGPRVSVGFNFGFRHFGGGFRGGFRHRHH
jgi:hypothetical protein